jgi:hypothetical protein
VLGLAFSGGSLEREFVAYWLAVAIGLPVFVRVLQHGPVSSRKRTGLWCGILLAELIAPVATLPAVKPQAALFPRSEALNALQGAPPPVRVLDRDIERENTPVAFLGIGAPQALAHGIATPRGANTLSVRHAREFLAFIADDPNPLHGHSPFTQRVVPNLEFANPELFRLLGVTHYVAPPEAPLPPGAWALQFVDPGPPAPPPLLPRSPDPLPPHGVRAARDPHPRAWIVPRAERCGKNPLAQLKACDFSRTVLISSEDTFHASEGTKPGVARIIEDHPNRVALELDGAGGWLVLSDVWFPGWVCRVDGTEVPVYRANHAFRAVPVPAGAQRAEFRFAPRSYCIGWWISAVSLGLVVLGLILGLRLSK